MSSNHRPISPLGLLVLFSVALTSYSGYSLSSSLSSNEKEIMSAAEKEIESIRAEAYRLSVKETFKLELLLLPVPIGIATMVDLMVMTSTLNDFSLEAHTPKGGFKFVKHPDSFHASLKQVSFSAREAFLKAHINMDKILLHAQRMFDNVESIKAIFESGEEQDIVHFIPEDLTSIKEAAAQCSQLSKEVVEKFIQVTELTEEVSLATTALKGGKGNLNIEEKKKFNSLELKKEHSKKMLRELEESKKKIEKEAADAYERASKAMDEMPGTVKTIFLQAADTIMNIFKRSDVVDKVYENANSKLKDAKDQLAKFRAEVDKATLLRQKEREEQFQILTEMTAIKFDKIDYKTAIDTLTRGIDNLAKLYQNWVEFSAKIESFIEITVVKNVENLNKWSKKILSGEMKITSRIENEIRMTTENANEHSVMMYQIASIYCKVSSNYILPPLSEWSRIYNTAGKSRDVIEANRKKLLKLCIEAESGIKKFIESIEKASQIKSIEKRQNRIEL